MQSSMAPSACHQTSVKQIQSSLISIPHLIAFTSSHSGSLIRRQPYRATVSRTELFLNRFSAFSKGILYWFLVFYKLFLHLCTLNQRKWPYEACFSVYFPTFFFFVCKKQSFRIWFEPLRYRCGPNHGCEMSFVFFFAGFVFAGRWATSDTWVVFRVQSLGFLRVGFLEFEMSERSNAVEAGKWGATRSLSQVQMLRGTGVLRRQVRDKEDEHHSDWWCWGFAQFDFDNFANFGFLDVGDRFGGGMGVKKRERERERTRVGNKTVLYQQICNWYCGTQ